MKKFGKFVLIILIIGAVLYGSFMIFVNPSGYTNTEDLTRDFFTNIHSNSACSTYFNPETEEFCDTFTALFDGETIVIDSLSRTNRSVSVTISVDGNSDSFEVTFVEIPVTGIKRFFNSSYYKIDIIE